MSNFAIARGACCFFLVLSALAACAPVGREAEWPPRAKEWFDRADAAYRVLDVQDASDAVNQAIKLQPQREEVRVLAAKVALAQLDFERTLKLLNGVDSSQARSLRGRAYWYSGQLDLAADELEALLADPDVRDTWARDVAKLARLGRGRKPFQMTGERLAVMEMPRLNTTALIVPVELNGEPALAMLATGRAEVVVDSASGREPKWISIGFGRRVTVKDVPAISEDLSGLSKQVGAPVKVLLGTNFLRHLNATFDFMGSQFVVRNFTPPPPPELTTLSLNYIRGGGMALRAQVGNSASSEEFAFMIDTSIPYPAALDDGGWKKAGVDVGTLKPIPGAPGNVRHGALTSFHLGGLVIPEVPGVYGVPFTEVETKLGVDLDGVLGSAMLAGYRVTLVDGGKTMWLEEAPIIPASPVGEPQGGPLLGPAPGALAP